MNININFTEKTLQILNEISVEEFVSLLTKMPELKEFKIVSIQFPTTAHRNIIKH